MSLFGGLLSAIGLGGSKTTVTQAAANTSNVEVQVANNVDLTPIAAVLEWLGISQAETAKETAKTNANTAATLVTALQDISQKKLELEKTAIEKIGPWVKVALGALVFYLITKALKGK